MNRLILIIIILLASLPATASGKYVVVFWNLENFFDHIDQGTTESDKEFSSFGTRHWTKRKFQTKCDLIAKSVMWIGDNYDRLPDVIGLAEIENRWVLWRLLESTLLRKYDYRIVHYESSDRRGIDVALLYRESSFNKLSATVTAPEYEGRRLSTRDMLQVCLEDSDGQKINMIVNHHPSKYGGAEESDGRRTAAMSALRDVCDSLMSSGENNIVAMGDFNDTPDGKQFDLLDGVLVNKADSLFRAGEGTIRYHGKWELIDMFMVSPSLYNVSNMSILQVPFLMTYERKYPGLKPLRTYTGPRYTGGVSDHCPIILVVNVGKVANLNKI